MENSKLLKFKKMWFKNGLKRVFKCINVNHFYKYYFNDINS